MLPPQLGPKHHVLFTFHHVSVEIPKEYKESKKEVATPVGYSWMTILDNNIIRGNESALPVAGYLPDNYLTAVEAKAKGSGPDVRWVDGKGLEIFRANTKLVSAIYTQVWFL